ncbi:unnamed protein product [Alternaria alternata]
MARDCTVDNVGESNSTSSSARARDAKKSTNVTRFALESLAIEKVFLHKMDTRVLPTKVQLDEMIFELCIHEMPNAGSVQRGLNPYPAHCCSCVGCRAGPRNE